MKEQIVAQAEKLFFSRGYNSVSLNSICEPLKIKPASLYYHFKGGKEELYLEVIRRRTSEFQSNIEMIAATYDDLETILKHFGYWYISQPPMNMMLIAEFDVPYLSDRGRKAVMGLVAQSVFESLGRLFTRFNSSLRADLDPFMMVGTLSVLLFSIHTAQKMGNTDRERLVDYNVGVFLRGVSV